MDPLEIMYESIDAVPEQFRGLYTEKDDGVHLTGVKGLKTQADIDRLSKALNGARGERDELNGKLKPFQEWLGDRSLDEVQAAFDEIEELRARAEAGGGEFPKDKLEELAERKVTTKLAPVERKLSQTEQALAEAVQRAEAAEAALTTRDLHAHLREIGEKAKLRPEAMADWLSLGERVFEKSEDGAFVSKDQSGVTPGVTADIVLGDLKQARPHWWPDSVGGGASGGRGGGTNLMGSANPWSEAGWSVTAQMAYAREHGAEKAAAAAKAAGVSLGATAPKRTTRSGV